MDMDMDMEHGTWNMDMEHGTSNIDMESGQRQGDEHTYDEM